MICQSKDADTEGGFVTMVTKQGLIKRTPLEQYANIRKTGLIGIALNEGDALASVSYTHIQGAASGWQRFPVSGAARALQERLRKALLCRKFSFIRNLSSWMPC